jgi:hypothetical protein
MDLSVEAQALKETLAAAANIVIVIPENASKDAVAAGLALYLSLQQANKTVKAVYPKQPTVAWSHLIGINKLVPQIGNKNFIISLDYIEGAIEKVSYNIEGDKFNLVIEPRPGAAEFSEKNVHYRYEGLLADLVITINALTLEDLGKVYTDNKALLDEKPLLNIDSNPNNKQYGKINLVRPAGATSEIVAELIRATQLPINGDIATNLYDGLVGGSRNFMLPIVSAHTFEIAAWLLTQGGRKQPGFGPSPEDLPRRELAGQKPDDQLPPDWLKPKIYKGSSLL